MSTLRADQIDDLQTFLKDWLRHTQSDLRRALRASSIRMPVLIEELQRTVDKEGLSGLAARLCGIEQMWQGEDQGLERDDSHPDFDDSLGQLDLLLEEIRQQQA